MKTNLKIMPATPACAHVILPFLRSGDRQELLRASDSLPEHEIERAIEASVWAKTAFIDGQPMATWGLVLPSLICGIGYPWCLTGRGIEQHKRLFMRASRYYLSEMLALAPHLLVMIDAEYKRALRWAEWLGFTLTGPYPWGPRNAPFMRADIMQQES